MTNNILHYKPLSDRVYERLLFQILAGRRPVRQKLSEVALAKEFGVSRVPVREALNRLTMERLVESIPRRGKFIKTFTIDEVREEYELRQALEPMALRLGFDKIDRGVAMKNYDRLCKIDKIKNVKQRYNLLLEADEDLHYIIRHYAGNRHLEQILQHVYHMTRPLRAFDAVESDRMALLTKERKEILMAIIRENISKAESLLIAHIRKGKESILAKLNEMQRASKTTVHGKQKQGGGDHV